MIMPSRRKTQVVLVRSYERGEGEIREVNGSLGLSMEMIYRQLA
jgi:hypothetical protein